MKKPEILAPGGSPESIFSAVNAGCDAIYAGGKRFGARAFADNQDNDRLIEIMDKLHLAGKKLYLTVNTVLTEREMGGLYDYLAPLYENGLDAVIVQDLGVLSFIHENFPDMAIHASTQMSITGGVAAGLLKKYGVTRIVPARELSLLDLKKLRKDTDVELEVFVHGALCSSYSGQCLMSSLIGGRSGNRGACAQPCRKMYSLNGKKESYVLSLKDLCTLDYIPDLIKTGIDSFKIEGRMKKPEYTALVTHIYRKYVDLYVELGDEAYSAMINESKEYRKDIMALKDIYNRGGFTSGYLTGDMNRKTMLSGNLPGHEGTGVGEIVSLNNSGRTVCVRYLTDIGAGDILEIRDRNGEKVHDYTMGHASSKGSTENVKTGYNYPLIKKGMEVYRVRNNMLIDKILGDYPVEMNKISIQGSLTAVSGRPLELSVGIDGTGDTYTVYGNEVTKADKHPADESYVQSKVMVSGDSIYAWSDLDVKLDEGIYISPAELKNIRRKAFEEYTRYYIDRYYRRSIRSADGTQADNINPDGHTYPCDAHTGRTHTDAMHHDDLTDPSATHFGTPLMIVELRNKSQLECIQGSDMIHSVDMFYLHAGPGYETDRWELCDAIHEIPFMVVLPRIIRTAKMYDLYREFIISLIGKNELFRGIVVCTPEQLATFGDLCDKYNLDIISSDNIYVRNHYSYDWLRNNGATGVMAAVEMTDGELTELNNRAVHNTSGHNISFLVYGKPAAMITAWTPGEKGKLKDRYNNTYTVLSHKEYNEILNYEPIDRIETFAAYKALSKRVMFTDERPDDIIKVLKSVIKQNKR